MTSEECLKGGSLIVCLFEPVKRQIRVVHADGWRQVLKKSTNLQFLGILDGFSISIAEIFE